MSTTAIIGCILLALTAVLAIIGIFICINYILEQKIRAEIMVQNAESATCQDDLDMNDSENDEVVAAIVAAITSVIDGETSKSSKRKSPAKISDSEKPSDPRVPFVIRRIHPL